MIMDHCWNDTDSSREKCSEMKLVHCKTVQLNPDIAGGANPFLWDEKMNNEEAEMLAESDTRYATSR